ncbi:MAG TPA: vWA domain-containing protein [Rectinemataceae bacterium]|nr:vWA domain-containing protein [Rectinemataceae bacterium]
MNGRFRLPPRLPPLLLLAVLALSPSFPQAAGPGTKVDPRSGDLDMVLLLDKSLSMAPFFAEAKSYVAGDVLGPILMPGDRLVIELVYGKVERLWSGTIESEADKAAAIRRIRAVVADGAYTDLGAGLDAAKRDVDELGRPERPKYVLLVTDERQEAPPGSAYPAADYRLKHPYLEYVKKRDLGRFRAITVGIGVGAKVEAAASQVMKYLAEPPARGGFGGTSLESSEAAAAAAKAQAAGGGGASGSPSPAQGPGQAQGQAQGQTPGAAAQAGGPGRGALPPWALPGGAVVLALAIGLLALLQLKKGKKSPQKDAHDAG